MDGIFKILSHFQKRRYLLALFLVPVYQGFSQLSPGDLTSAHAHLEGMSHCTDCHTLGAKVSNEKCLDCHVELHTRIKAQKGYHSSSQIKGKECSSCHNEHHGRNFRIINFETQGFDHDLTGFELLGAHKKEECKSCHKPAYIKDEKIRSKDFTFLGLETQCLSCHEDYHRGTLSSTCTDCHGQDDFKPALKFDHSKAKFPLLGRHREVECLKCHKVSVSDGKTFQEFTGIPYDKCTSCHEDVHKNKFGQNCLQCHSVDSFKSVSGMGTFDHNRADFPLVDKHLSVECKSCHKTRLTDPVKHTLCSDCHVDYHLGQFTREGVTPDCASCHDTKGFIMSSFTIERHNDGNFPLSGAHLATPCFVCHKKAEKWQFSNIGRACADCHEDIHQALIDPKYYPEKDCRKCHSTERWTVTVFDHSRTSFELTGKHKEATCRDCHFHESEEGKSVQRFKGLGTNCQECHTDTHQGQFAEGDRTRCDRCHRTEYWKINVFDHSKTRFALDGKHANVACNKCHKPIKSGSLTYIQYKFEDIRCEACHQ